VKFGLSRSAVTLVASDTFVVLGTAEFRGHVRPLRFDPTGTSLVLVTVPRSKKKPATLWITDTRSMAARPLADLGRGAQIHFADPESTRAYAVAGTNKSKPKTIDAFDLAALEPPRRLASNDVSIFDVEKLDVVDIVHTGGGSQRIVQLPGDPDFWVQSRENLAHIDTSTNRIDRTIDIPAASYSTVSYETARERAWIHTRRQVRVFDLRTGAEVGQANLPESVQFLWFDPSREVEPGEGRTSRPASTPETAREVKVPIAAPASASEPAVPPPSGSSARAVRVRTSGAPPLLRHGSPSNTP
jgi:hypothetical protein